MDGFYEWSKIAPQKPWCPFSIEEQSKGFCYEGYLVLPILGESIHPTVHRTETKYLYTIINRLKKKQTIAQQEDYKWWDCSA